MEILCVTSRSVTIELASNNPYYHEKEYDIFLNGNKIGVDNKNVITIYDLSPKTKYQLAILDRLVEFETKNENILINVKDFNAIGNGIIDDTAKIQAAIMCAPKDSTIYFPKGTYLVTSIYLKSDINLYFEQGAKLLAKTERNDFPIHPGIIGEYNFGVWEGSEVNNFSSILNFINVSNVNIIGPLEIDPQAENGDWYINHRVMNIAYRGHAIFTNRSENINFIGTYVHNTQSWAIHPYFSENINFYNVSVENNQSMPTTDGIDPDCCKNVKIMGCYFNVGDDCIAIKSGTIELAKKYRRACEGLIIKNNYMKQGHGGVVFGSESSGGIKNVLVECCLFENTDRGLRIKTRRGRGNIGSIDNVTFNNIKMINVKTPFVINMYYNMGPKGGHEEYVWTTKALPVDENTPVLGAFKFSNMKCVDVEYAAGVFLGLPEMPIKKIELENVSFIYKEDACEGYPVMIEHNFTMKKVGLYAFNVSSIVTNNVTFSGVETEEIIKRRN